MGLDWPNLIAGAILGVCATVLWDKTSRQRGTAQLVMMRTYAALAAGLAAGLREIRQAITWKLTTITLAVILAVVVGWKPTSKFVMEGISEHQEAREAHNDRLRTQPVCDSNCPNSG